MTNEKHTSGERLPQTKTQQRQLKVREEYHSYQLSQNGHQRTPIGEIHLKDHWLIQAGFEIDSPVKVRVMEGCLVLTSEL
ncbi:hypothetical protein AB835_14930 [Candidatus Endobugula sertula]|uniref:Toxin SymE-like domain-containing protein n=1 Tax=Candidatus Endobugula sertula TaxID=62101 RepID=A0A1D2QL60_9GAMM|nr:hypothetical protein AB835_14930 [Candidatus Endobugula sertula]